MYNLMFIDPTIGAHEREQFESKITAFEKAYLKNKLDEMANPRREQEKYANMFEDKQSKFVRDEYQWWLDALDIEKDSGDDCYMLRSIREKVSAQYTYTLQREMDIK